MITPTDQQITAAFKTSNTAHIQKVVEGSKPKLNEEGERFADELLNNEQFQKTVETTKLMTVLAGTPGLQAGLMRAFLAGFEAGKVVDGEPTGAPQGVTSFAAQNAGKPRC
jgi:hypothetical protein